jgi:hypothetical protein
MKRLVVDPLVSAVIGSPESHATAGSITATLPVQ